MDEIVSGEIVFIDDPPNHAAEIVVQVEDVADAPSVVVGEQRQRRVQLRGVAAVPFRIAVPPEKVQPGNLYSVRAHVDIEGTGQVRKGDFVSTQGHPVLTRGFGRTVRVPVKRV